MIEQYKLEMTVIGRMVLDKEDGVQGVEGLTEEDFTDRNTKRLFNIMKSIHDDGLTIEVQNIDCRIEDGSDTDQCMKNCFMYSQGAFADFRDYMVQLKGETRKRRFNRLFQNGINALASDDCEAQLDKVISDLRRIDTEDSCKIKDIEQLVVSELDYMLNKNESAGIKTGFPYIDYLTNGGFKAGNLVAIGAYTSVGKSLLAQNLAVNMMTAGKKVLFVSLEMNDHEVFGERMLPMITGKSYKYLAETPEGNHLVIDTTNELIQNNRFHFLDGQSMNVTGICSACRSLNRQVGLDCVFIDYLQIVRPAGRSGSQSRTVELGEITREFKTLASELECPVVVCAQCNRQTEEQNRPYLRNLRESGSIESDSNIVLLLSNSEDDDGSDKSLFLAKNRSGRTTGEAKIPLKLNSESLKLTEMIQEQN